MSNPGLRGCDWDDLWVQGRADPQREILDVESVAGHLLPSGGMFAFLAAHRRELFPDELFADLFATRKGRPSIPADVVASVIVLQTLHGLSDEAAAEAVTFDLRWKAACGLAVIAWDDPAAREALVDALVSDAHRPLRPAVPDGFTLDDFTVDEKTATVTCPNGLTARITRTRKVTFGARCRDCPFRTRCTTSTRGRKLTLHKHDRLQRAHRQRARAPEFQAVYRQHRPMVERSIAWLVAGGNRRLRFRGTRLNDLWLHHRVAGLNLRRLLALGLTRTSGTWAIA